MMETRQGQGLSGWLLISALTLGAVSMAAFGWWQVSTTQDGHALSVSDIIYHALKSIEMGEAYDSIGLDYHGNIYLDIARFLGMAVHIIAVLFVAGVLMGQTLTRARASLRRRHLVVIGDTAFADKLALLSRQKVNHLRARHEPVGKRGRLIRLPFEGLTAHSANDAAIRHARGVVVATADEAEAASIGLEAQHLFPGAHITVKLNDRWLAQSLHQIEGAGRLRAFSESGVFSREIVRRHPPYLLARDLGHARIHALLMGEPDWLEALMAEIVLSACTLSLGKPAFSFLCVAPDDFRARLKERYPELEVQADLAFYDADFLNLSQGFYLAIEEMSRHGPITAVYCLRSQPADALATSLALIERARRDATFRAPIFALLGNSRIIERPVPGSLLAPLTLVPFGSHEDMARASGLLGHEADLAEQAFHNAYMKFAGLSDGEAALPWYRLKEEYRTSNRRAVAHIYAKLFEAGFDLRRWMAAHDIWAELPGLAEPLWRSDDELQLLAELEHERWIADRRMNGWSYGAVRDNQRRLHPDIVPFHQLTAEKQAYDVKFIELLEKVLKSKKDGMQRAGV